MVNYVLLSANVIVTMKLKFAAQLERMQMVAQSNQLVNQKAQTCTMKSVLASVSNHANIMKFHANNLMIQIMAVLTQITVRLSKLITLENSVTCNNANLSVIIPNTFVKVTSDMMAAKKTIFAYQNNLMISPQTVCAQELVQLNARTGKSNVMEQLITTVIFTRAAKVKMFATPRLKMSTECSVLENLIPMVALILAHLKKSCVQPRKDLLGAKKQPHVKTEQPMMKENIAQTPLTAQLFAHQIMSIAQEELTKMDARTLIFV